MAGAEKRVPSGHEYVFALESQAVAEGQAYPVLDTSGISFVLYFTSLPLISILTVAPIVDEPRVPGHVVLAYSSGQLTNADPGIEVRGGLSQTWSKKSCRLEFHSSPAMGEEVECTCWACDPMMTGTCWPCTTSRSGFTTWRATSFGRRSIRPTTKPWSLQR